MSIWTIEHYKTQSGTDVITEWLNNLEESTNVQILDQILRLKIKGTGLTEPHVKHLEGKLYELRTKDTKGIYRIIYFAHTGKKLVLCGTHLKK